MNIVIKGVCRIKYVYHIPQHLLQHIRVNDEDTDENKNDNNGTSNDTNGLLDNIDVCSTATSTLPGYLEAGGVFLQRNESSLL